MARPSCWSDTRVGHLWIGKISRYFFGIWLSSLREELGLFRLLAIGLGVEFSTLIGFGSLSNYSADASGDDESPRVWFDLFLAAFLLP